jgi:hypothetical protein
LRTAVWAINNDLVNRLSTYFDDAEQPNRLAHAVRAATKHLSCKRDRRLHDERRWCRHDARSEGRIRRHRLTSNVGSDHYWGVLPPQTIRRAVLSENFTGLRRSSTTFTLRAIEDGPQLRTQSSIEDHGKIDTRPPCIIGGLSNSIAALRCIAFSLRVNKAPLFGAMGPCVYSI